MIKNTLNVGQISEGFVLDHIQAGRSMDIYKYLHLDKLDCCVAIIKNAKSNKMGKKDIMKIDIFLLYPLYNPLNLFYTSLIFLIYLFQIKLQLKCYDAD